VLKLSVHGSRCGLTGSDACLVRFVWREADGFVFTGGPEARPQLWVGVLPQALPPSLRSAPSALRRLVLAQRRICGRKGGRFLEENLFGRVVDLDGDGVPDWMYANAYGVCDYAEGHEPEAPEEPCQRLLCRSVFFLSGSQSRAPSRRIEAFVSRQPCTGFEAGPGARVKAVEFQPKRRSGAPYPEACFHSEPSEEARSPLSLHAWSP
jgi:hypothetical protein